MEIGIIQNFWANNRLTIKGIMVGFLILVLLIPGLFINELVKERADRQQQVIAEVSSKWASSQTLAGPVLMVPYNEYEKTTDGKVVTVKRMAYFLPDDLKITGAIDPEIRNRSIFKIVVYDSRLKLEGNFGALQLDRLKIAPFDLLLSEAQLCVGLSDFRGIKDQLSVNWNSENLAFNAGVPTNTIIENGLSVPISINSESIGKANKFSIDIKLKGSESLFFVPVGKVTNVNIASSWDNPSFNGAFLPETPSVGTDGFHAEWKILHLNRNYPQTWKDAKYNVYESAFGINLLQPTDGYAKTQRSVKYAILFITLTFTLYFFIEILQKKRVHPLQYILVGLALCVFYTLLLSIAEYLGFDYAYYIAATATVLLISAYTYSVFNSFKIAAVFLVALTLLYGFIFVLIRLQDGALLFGSIGLFLVLAIVMYYSRKVEWFGQAASPNPALSI